MVEQSFTRSVSTRSKVGKIRMKKTEIGDETLKEALFRSQNK